MNSRKAWVGLAAIILIATAAFAQEFRGRIQGMVSDPSGGVVQNAKVVLKNDNTGVQVTRTSNRDGRYLFDYVDPGYYSVTVEQTGFKTKVQKNILVQQRGDVTVDVKLEVGELTEVITVAESPVAVQFNTATRDLTVDQQMVRELPSSTRNPFQLAMLDPTIQNRGATNETMPYHHRTENEMDLGGGTKYRNDALLDGTPLTAGNKLGYTPPMDAVTEYTVQQNSVDAEFGHSAGGIVMVTTKSGSNDIKGSVYYFGRDPSLNAITDRVGHTKSNNPFWNAGATVGFPIQKNKLFAFVVFERINNTDAIPGTYTLPTALERQGDFSQSFDSKGALRVIYDPTSNPRKPYPGNRIPAGAWDPLAKKLMDNMWMPNSDGDDPSHANNFKYLEERTFKYYNFSARLDYQISDKWKAWARVSRMKTDQPVADFTAGNDPLKMRNVTGSKRNGWNIAADTVYTLSPTTALNLRGSWYQAEDKRDYPDMAISEADYASMWPSGWYKTYEAGRPLLYFPHMVIESNAYGRFGAQNFWWQIPSGSSLHARLSKYFTKHTLKLGTEVRFKRGEAARFYYMDYRFSNQETGKDYNKTSTTTGHGWASFLIGAINSATNIRYNSMQIANTEMYAVYLQDDFKVTKNLTLNLGLRYEYEGGFWDPENRLPQQLDLTDPIPGMQDVIAPKLTSLSATGTGKTVAQLMAESTGAKSYTYTGNFKFTEEGNNRKTKADRKQFAPRIGLAWRLDDKTVFRAGYGRFTVPSSLANSEADTLGEMDLGGYTPTTNALSTNVGIPRAYLSNPFPQGLNPIVGKSLGRYTNLGSAVTINKYEQHPPRSDRFNFSLQRELPGRIIVDATYYMNFVSGDYFNINLDQMDPRLRYTYGNALDTKVANPFYNYGTADTFPGTMRTTSTVSISSLLVPYPQYSGITQSLTDLRKSRYQSFQLRLQRPFKNGFSLLATYAYVKSKTQWYYDAQDQYDGILSWFDFSSTQGGGAGSPTTVADPGHNFTIASTIAIPVGRGRALGREMPKALDAVIGGWQVSGMYRYNSGALLIFNTTADNPSTAPALLKNTGAIKDNARWFDITGFSQTSASPNVRRSNPWSYDGVTGPTYNTLDLGIVKRFTLSQRVKLDLRLEAFNALNGMNWQPPATAPGSTIGIVNTQIAGYAGRQLQYSARIEF
jgi:hypothetical protein